MNYVEFYFRYGFWNKIFINKYINIITINQLNINDQLNIWRIVQYINF